jgi:hypothetical protein
VCERVGALRRNELGDRVLDRVVGVGRVAAQPARGGNGMGNDRDHEALQSEGIVGLGPG